MELAREKPRFGYRRLHVLLRRYGECVNHMRVHRVYREAGLSIRRKKWKHCVRAGQPLRAWTAANQEWALDFVHDAVDGGCHPGQAVFRHCRFWLDLCFNSSGRLSGSGHLGRFRYQSVYPRQSIQTIPRLVWKDDGNSRG